MHIIDLFSGAGGLTEGFLKEGYKVIAHVEKDKNACKTLETRLAYHHLNKSNLNSIYHDYLKNNIDRHTYIETASKYGFNSDCVICEEISLKSIESVFQKIDLLTNDKIDGIIGGPPCQAYSTIGRPLNDLKKDNDERVYLYKLYINFLEKYSPNFFLFENVKGLLSYKDHTNEILLNKIIQEFKDVGYNVELKLIDTSHYGVSQSRERLFIFGSKVNRSFFSALEQKKQKPISLEELFYGLPNLSPGEAKSSYKRVKNINKINNLEELNIKSSDWNILTQHVARPHNQNDLEIYKIVALSKSRGKQIKYNELPLELQTHRNNQSFLDRYKALKKNSISHTVVAHIAKDGHYYIHFDSKQNRSITPREAARIQSFPDDYFFESSRTSAFKQIGNAVPPLMSQKIAQVVKEICPTESKF